MGYTLSLPSIHFFDRFVVFVGIRWYIRTVLCTLYGALCIKYRLPQQNYHKCASVARSAAVLQYIKCDQIPPSKHDTVAQCWDQHWPSIGQCIVFAGQIQNIWTLYNTHRSDHGSYREPRPGRRGQGLRDITGRCMLVHGLQVRVHRESE